MQPDMPPSDDPQVLQDEFDVNDPSVLVNPDAPLGDAVELFDVSAMPAGMPCYGVACVEGIPDGGNPRRMWAPGALDFGPTPFPFKAQLMEAEGHFGSIVSGRVDAMWRDGSLIRWVGQMDSAGQVGAEHERLIAGGFMTGVSIKADDIEDADVEFVYGPEPDLTAVPVAMGLDDDDDELDDDELVFDDEGGDDEEFAAAHGKDGRFVSGKGGGGGAKKAAPKKAAGAPRKKRKTMQEMRNELIKPMPDAGRDRFLHRRHSRPGHENDPHTRASVDGAVVADGMDMEMGPKPIMLIYHSGRVRSLTGVAEPAFVECTVSLGVSPFKPPLIAESVPAPTPETVPPLPPPAAAPVVLASRPALAAAASTRGTITAAGGTVIRIPELWPESWFDQPTDAELAMCAAGGGAIQITPEGRVYGLMAPARVGHRGFRASGQLVTAPRGIDYSEWQNKPCLVAGADGGVYKILAGTATFDCGHPDPYDPRRADPSFASRHYDDSCSVAMRARAGEHAAFGTWFAGGLRHGLSADQFERIMGCALSGDWQGGKLKGALLVPVEGFPVAASGGAMVREKFGTMVASAVPIRMEPQEIEAQVPLIAGDFSALFDLVASATGRGPQARFDELAEERFREFERERG